MQIIRYLLCLGSASIILAEYSYGPDNEDIQKTVDNGVQNGIPQNNTEMPDSHQPAAPLHFKIAQNEDWVMSQQGTKIMLRPKSHSGGTQSGGPFSATYRFGNIIIGWEVEGSKKLLLALVTYNNDKYSFKDAPNHEDCIIQIPVLININENTDNPQADEFLKALLRLDGPGTNTPIRSGFGTAFFQDYHDPKLKYEFYPSSYIDESTGKSYDCSTTIQIPENKDGNYVSNKQFEIMRTIGKDSSGKPLDYNLPSLGEQLSGKGEGEGYELEPI